MLTEVQYNTYMKDNLEVNAVSWAHWDAEEKKHHYENGILYSICIRKVFFSHFFPLNKVLGNPEIDYKAWAFEMLTDDIERYFDEIKDGTEFFTVEELEDRDFSKGSLEFMSESEKEYIKKLSFDEIHAITWN